MSSPSPPPAVSSLRSRFEQLAASSAQNQPMDPPRRAGRPRSLSNSERETLFCPEVANATGTSDTLGLPTLRASPSSPDLKSSGKFKPAPPPPRGSRTPSPQPPTHPSSPVSQSPMPTLRKRPPPPPPGPKPNPRIVEDVDELSPGGVAALKSLFNENPKSMNVLGNGRPAQTQAKVSTVRSSSASICPPALPARPLLNHSTSPTKGSRASLPALSKFHSEPSPISLSPTPRVFCGSPATDFNIESDDTSHVISRIPPPIPSRQSDPAKVMESIDRPEHYRSSSDSTNSSGSEHNNVPPGLPPRRVTPVPPPLPQRRSGSEEAADLRPALPRRPSWDPSTESTPTPPAIPIATKPIRSTPTPPTLPSRPEPPPTRMINNIDPPLRTSNATPTRGLNGIEPPPSRILNGIPPPPVRTVGINDKLPAARKRKTSDDDSDDSSDEHDPRTTLKTADASRAPIDELPDATNCSRRPPISSSSFFRASVPALAGSTVAVAGHLAIVSHHHHLRIYDLSKGVHSGLTEIDLRSIGVDFKKEARVTAMEFRTDDGLSADPGRFLWCGTREGHLFEFDTANLVVTRLRLLAHMNPVVRIIRYGLSMVTLDEAGKALIWRHYTDLAPGQQPRVARTTEKQGFIHMFGGLLWTSGGIGSGIGGTSTSRGPILRIYDIMASNCSAKMVSPSDPLGAVTSGAILTSQPGTVYLGHVGGFISVWRMEGTESFDSGRKVPVCVQTLKVASSDIMSLEGVGERLWAGSRGGVIAAYEVGGVEESGAKPWRVTNAWRAHGELPILRIFVDPFSIAKAQALNVISVGRDEQMKFWDGLLGAEWIESEVQQREQEFSTFRSLNILICSWNTDAQKPDTLTRKSANISFLKDVLRSVDKPDIIVFGFQELIDLENRSLTAKTVLLGGQKKNADGTLSDKVSRAYRMWYESLVHAMRLAMPVEDPYVVAHTDNLVGLFSCIFVRQRQKALLRDSAMKTVKRGMGGRYGNKGAIVARFVFDDSSLCFINCHLAAGQSHTRQRNQDIAAILEDGAALPRSEVTDALPYAGGGDGSMILDHEICFLNGDLNYRIDLRRDVIVKAVQEGDYQYLLNHDQLRKQMKNHPGFRLRAFHEAPINFAPTYKYDRRSEEYDTSEKRRAPAWCDRILWHCRQPERVEPLHYQRYEVDVSDHRPISGAFRVTVKKIDHDARAQVKSEIQRWWQERETNLLFAMREFYETQCIL